MGIHENYETGDVQLISAGKGLYHEGGNVPEKEESRHLQIWVAPRSLNTEPSVTVRKRPDFRQGNSWELMVSPDGDQESLKINQDVWMFSGKFTSDKNITYIPQEKGHKAMIYLLKGEIQIDLYQAQAGDTLFSFPGLASAVAVITRSEFFIAVRFLSDSVF